MDALDTNGVYRAAEGRRSPGRARGFPWFEGFFLGVVPLAYLLLGPFELYPPPGWVDAGMYLGYFLDLPRKLSEFGPNYHGMRLPFTLSGFLVNRIFSPDFANYFLVLGFHYLALFSVYFAVRAHNGRAAAVAAGLFLAVNPLWIATVTRGYVDGPGMSFLFTSLAFLANRGRAMSSHKAAAFAGVMAGFSASCNIVAGLMTALTALAWLVAEGTPWRDLWRIIVYGFAGLIALVLVLGLTSRAFGGTFLFFSSDFNFGTQTLGGFGSHYIIPLRGWVPESYRLALPVAFLGIAATFLVPRRNARPNPSLLRAGCYGLGLAVAFLLLFDFGIGGTMMQSSFYASYLIPGQCLIFGGLAALLLPRHEESWPVPGWVATAAAVTVAGILPLLGLERLWAIELAGRQIYLLWLVILVLFLTAIALMHRGIAALGLATVMFASVIAATANADTRRIFRVGANPDYRSAYEATVRVHAIVESARAPDRRLYTWYCRQCFTTGNRDRDKWLQFQLRFSGEVLNLNVLDSIASLWLWDTSWLNFTMPSLSAEDVHKLTADPRGSTLVLLCTSEPQCAEAAEVLRRAGVTMRERVRVPILEHDFDLHLLMLDISGSAKD